MSLQDQLLKAGLVDEKKAKNINKAKHQQRKQKKGKKQPAEVDAVKLAVQQADAEKAERDRQLNQQRKAEAERKAIAAQIRQLIEMNRQQKDSGDIAYSFADNNKIRQLYVNETQQRQLGNGQLSVVTLDERYEIVPTSVAEKIRLRDASYVVYTCEPEQRENGDEDDPYAEFQVPDDLMW